MFEKLMKEIDYAKNSVFPNRSLYHIYGKIKMARELEVITADEFMELNHECVYKGINNPKYFD